MERGSGRIPHTISLPPSHLSQQTTTTLSSMQLALWTLALAASAVSAAQVDASTVLLGLAIAPVTSGSDGAGDSFTATFNVNLKGS